MATPYVVSKIPIAKTSNEFDRCNGDNGPISSCTANVPNISNNSCRFSCSSWCPMCERKGSNGQHDALTKSLVDGLRKVDNSIHDGLKSLQPVMNKLNSHVIKENLGQKFSSLSHNAGLFVSPSRDSKTPEPCSSRRNDNCVHEKYVKEVEALKGKIQELRQNLNKQFSEPENIITLVPKVIWNKDNSSDTKPQEHRVGQHDVLLSNSAECKRTKRLSESENSTGSTAAVGQKRPRDISPEFSPVTCDKPDSKVSENCFISSKLNKSSCPSPVKLKEQNISKGLTTHASIPHPPNPLPQQVVACPPVIVSPPLPSTPVISSSPQAELKPLIAETVLTPPEKELVKSFLSQNQGKYEKITSVPYPSIQCQPPIKTNKESATLRCSPSLQNFLSQSQGNNEKITSVPYPTIQCKPPVKTMKETALLRCAPLFKRTKNVEVRESIHPALRPSLFPNVPPFIQFVSHDTEVVDPLPLSVSKVLRWKITTITPLVVRKTVLNSGFKLVKQSPDWTGTWGKHMKSVMFRTIRENQKINHFPGTFQIGRKDKLWKNLHHLMIVFSKREFGFIPRTYILPQDVKLLRIAWERDGGNDSMWIVKPPASARGTGIKVVNKWAQIPKKAPIIVQKYISNPYLINGNKFDLRLYALVTSFNPLRIYLYDNGLVRFASVKYSEDLSSLSDRYMHLTNYSINKLSNNYHHNEDADACQGHKWTIKTLFTYLQEKVDVKALWERLVDLVIKTTLCGESSICNLSKNNLTSHYCSYELFGVDVLLDENLTPWLLEVNISPSLHSASPLDLAVKGPLITDILNIAGYQIPDKLNDSLKNDLRSKLGLEENVPICYNKDLFIAGLSTAEKHKHKQFIDVERHEYLETIVKDLTPDDIRHLIRYEDELTQIGSFEKIFPTADSHEYLKYFESPQYYNKLFDAWETKYSNNRLEGIKHLQDLCNKGYHLDVQDVSLHVSVSASELAEGLCESAVASDLSENTQRTNGNQGGALKVLRRRRKVNLTGRPYGRFNKARLRRPRT